MALLRANEFKIVENTNILELRPREGEAFRVKRVEVAKPSTETFAEIIIGRATTGYFAVNKHGFNHLAPVVAGEATKNIFDVLEEKGKPLIYPVAEGEAFIVRTTNNVDFIKVIYDVYEAADVKPDEPNGSQSNELFYLLYLTNATDWDDPNKEFYTLDAMLNPEEFPNFPIESVPSKATIELHGIFGVPLATSKGDGSNTLGTSFTKRVRLYYQRKVLFDPDRRGFLFKGNEGYSETGTKQTYDYSEIVNELPFVEDHQRKMKFFDEPLVFESGEELLVQVGTKIDADAPIQAGKITVGLILKIKYE